MNQFCTEYEQRFIDLALRVVAGASYFKWLLLERHYRDVRAGLFYSLDSNETLERLGKSAFGISMVDEDAICA